MSYSPRTASVTRKTNETSIQVALNLDATPGSGIQQEIDVKTGVGFLDHVRSFGSSPFARIKLIRAPADASCPRKAQRMVLEPEV
jgi:imidazoleglycerol phosphate dehydratase HisB